MVVRRQELTAVEESIMTRLAKLGYASTQLSAIYNKTLMPEMVEGLGYLGRYHLGRLQETHQAAEASLKILLTRYQGGNDLQVFTHQFQVLKSHGPRLARSAAYESHTKDLERQADKLDDSNEPRGHIGAALLREEAEVIRALQAFATVPSKPDKARMFAALDRALIHSREIADLTNHRTVSWTVEAAALQGVSFDRD